jgi:hypothetical protein
MVLSFYFLFFFFFFTFGINSRLTEQVKIAQVVNLAHKYEMGSMHVFQFESSQNMTKGEGHETPTNFD